MTLPASGPISLSAINTEFGLGTNLNAYRGVTWYTDTGTTGTFTTSDLGMNQFYSKRATAPGVTDVDSTYASDSSVIGTSYSFSNVPFTSGSVRRVVVAVTSWNATSSAGAISSASIAGNAATVHVDSSVAVQYAPAVAIFSATVPTSTASGTVAFTYNTNRQAVSIVVYAVVGGTAIDAVASNGGVNVSSLSATPSYTGYPRGVIAVSGGYDPSINNISWASWTGVTNGDAGFTNPPNYIAFANGSATISGNTAVQVNYITSVNYARLAVAAFK